MQDSKVPTLSIGPKKPKVFGKPNQSPQLTLKTQKSPSSASKSPSVTPKKISISMSPGVTTPTDSNSSKKQTNSKIEASINNEDVDSIIEANDDFSKNSQKSTPSRKKDSNLSTHYDKDRASVISVSSAKKNNIPKNSSVNSDKKEFDQLFESIDNDNSELNSEITTPIKPEGSIRSSSSAKKNQQKQSQDQLLVDNSPANSRSAKQNTTPTSMRTNTISSAKSDQKNNMNSNKKSKASTPNSNTRTNPKYSKKENDRTFSTGDDSYDYSPTNSPKRRKNSPQRNKGQLSPIVKDIIPLVKTLLVNNNDNKKDTKNDNDNDSNNKNIIDDYKMSDVAESLEEWQKTIISQATPIEESQIQLWYDSLIEIFKQQNFYVIERNEESTEKDEPKSKDSQKIDFLDEIIKNAREILQNHRFSYSGGYDHRFKLIVTGPNHSGKSTYLSILAQQLLFELIACGDWKKNFIFPINFSNIAHICQDLGQLFVEMARLSIQALCAQRPLLIKYSTSLTESFAAVVNGKPSLPRTFVLDEDFRLIAPQVQQLLDICYECYHDSQAMTSFTANACMLPFFIANAFGGFSNVIVIADHFDLSDVTKTASQPFEDSPDNVFIAEIYKYLLMQTSFIIGAKYESALNEVLTSLDVQNSSFSQGIEFLPTYNIINKKNNSDSTEEEEESNDDSELVFTVSFADANETLTIVEDLFEGCPIYLSKYNIVRNIAQKIEKGEKLEDEKLSSTRNENYEGKDIDNEEIDVEEEKLKLVIKMEELLRLTMISQDGSPYNLKAKSVTFNHKEKKQKKTGKKTESENK